MIYKLVNVLWIAFFFAALVALYLMKTFYGDVGSIRALLHLAITAIAFGFNLFYFSNYPSQIWGPVTVVNSFIIGLLPYKQEITRITQLLSNPNIEPSTISDGLPRAVAIAVDGLFFVTLTFALLLLSSLVKFE